MPPERNDLVNRVLLTAFDADERWPENSSWLALVELTRWYDGPVEITTRRYSAETAALGQQLRKDVQEDFDIALHISQSPGAPLIELEGNGANARADGTPLIPNAPDVYRSDLPLETAATGLRQAGIPASVSRESRCDIGNAALYLSQHYAASFGMSTRSALVRVPLAPSQVAQGGHRLPSMSTAMTSAGLILMMRHFSGL